MGFPQNNVMVTSVSSVSIVRDKVDHNDVFCGSSICAPPPPPPPPNNILCDDTFCFP